jgi:hypothetical protein
MQQPQENPSIIAQMRAALELDCQALANLKGTSIAASHTVINNKYNAIEKTRSALAGQIGEEAATDAMVDAYNKAMQGGN